jgi:exodeoxyribonuclease VII large subunit
MGFLSDPGRVGGDTWTVSELNSYIREIFDIDYRLQDLAVTGEVSNFVRARSGHLYFTLKDESAQIRCVMWRSAAEQHHALPGDGDSVLITGRVSVYEAGGAYQLYAESIQPMGRGDLALAFEQLKQRLAAEGLFDPEYKQTIPRFPQKIGIVTSADAAALRDILHVLERRYPLISVLIAPTLVQGADAPSQIVRALRWLDGRDDIDTIIIARGGGSIEDLWAFNDEMVARAVFSAQHPVIAGVGHETDYTIADFVADLRAPTPSAAAEMAVPDLDEIRPILQGWREALRSEMTEHIERERWQLQALARTLGHLSPRATVDNSRQRVDLLYGRLGQALENEWRQANGRLTLAEARLSAISPLATPSRGYSIVRGPDDQIIRSVKAVTGGDKLTIQVIDGEFDATVDGGKGRDGRVAEPKL